MTYTVTLTFQYPAWDETRGILFHNIEARSKSEAIRIARRMARNFGHIGHGGKGRVTFKAQETGA